MKRTIIALIILLTACATPEGMKAIRTKEKVVYNIPSEGVLYDGSFSGIGFNVRPYESVRSGFKYLRDAKVTAKGDDRCQVSFMTYIVPTAKNATQSPGIAYNSYIFRIDRSSRKGTTRVEFKPLYEVLEPVVSFKEHNVSPPHGLESAMELIATSGTLTLQFEVDSPLKTAAVQKNLQKYFKKRSHPRHPVSILQKSYDTSYLLTVSGNTVATFYISLLPQQRGTKAVVIAKMQLAPDPDYQIDGVYQAKNIKKVVSDAINR